MKKQEPQFQIGDIVRVVMPVLAMNLKDNDQHKLDVEEVMLIGDEGLIITEVEYLKRQNEYLYQVLTENGEDAKMFSLSEEQLTLFE
jgi:hypothetical protein